MADFPPVPKFPPKSPVIFDFPGPQNRNKGALAKTALLQSRPFVSSTVLCGAWKINTSKRFRVSQSQLLGTRMGSQHPSPIVKTLCNFEPQMGLKHVTSRDAKMLVFKAAGHHVM